MGVYTSILLCLGMFVRSGEGERGDRYRLRGGGEKANVSSGGKPHDAQERASKLSRCQDVNSGIVRGQSGQKSERSRGMESERGRARA